jgi:hypothetical protein
MAEIDKELLPEYTRLPAGHIDNKRAELAGQSLQKYSAFAK